MTGLPRSVTATAPVRTADVGGWTDTWYARTGAVCNVAVGPGVRIDAAVRAGGLAGTVELTVGDGPPTMVEAGPGATEGPAGSDPLLVAALRSVPLDRAVSVHVTSSVPPGSGLGTSAAVTVALLAALHALRGEQPEPSGLAAAAHGVETGLGLQSGVQDQLAAAHGGIRLYEISYPGVSSVGSLAPDAPVVAALADQLLTVYLGRPHASSAMHEAVIARLEQEDPEPALRPMRDAARQAFEALGAGDLVTFGVSLVAHHEAQRRLHPDLIGSVAREVELVAATSGALGWKVNGAGGEGGSMVVLAPADPQRRRALEERIATVPGCRLLRLAPSATGVTIRAD